MLPRRLALVMRDLGRAAFAHAHAARVAEAAVRSRAELIVETQVGFVGSGALASARSGVPLILDDCSPSLEEIELGAGLPWLARRVLRRQARAARAIVAVTGHARDRLIEEGVPADLVRIVPNGVELEAFAAARRTQGSPDPSACAAVFVGSFQPWHRVGLLVEALALLRDAPITLVLAGEGPSQAPALARARELGVAHRVTSLGPVPHEELPALLARCDVGVLPGTVAHAHPMKLLEYAAAGLPCLAPDVAAVRALDGLARDTLFDDGDAASLARALARLANDPAQRRSLGESARALVTATASWRERAKALVS